MSTKQLTVLSKEISPIVQKAQDLIISDGSSMEQASDFRSKLKAEEKRIKADKEKITKPLNEGLKEVRLKYKPAEEQIEKALGFLDEKMSEYQLNLIQEQRKEEAKIADRIGEGKGHIKLETAVKKIGELEPIVAPASTSFRSDYVLEITSEKDIPREYLIINESVLFRDLKAGLVVSGAKLKEILIPVNKRS